MEMPGLKKRAEDKRQAVHQQLSQCQLGRDSERVRKTPHGVETRSHSRETFWSPCLRRGFFCLALSTDQVVLTTASSLKTPRKHYH